MQSRLEIFSQKHRTESERNFPKKVQLWKDPNVNQSILYLV
jgi:hypothetical protein